MTNLFDLKSKIALVTGASRGIGEEIAKLLAQQGAHVIVSSRKIDDCEAVARGIREAGGSAEAVACHVGRIEDIQAIFGHIRERHGRLDILVNNAAANPYFGHILDTDLASFEKTVEVNLRGYFFMSVEAGKLMREHGGGAIVVNMTRAFAKECGPLGIRVNALLPGLTKTRFAGALFADQALYDDAIGKIPLRRHAEPREMAGTVLYLVSDASSYTNGECIVVDGGLTI
jgi:NAD(P)-dependent dehydrogenase (short-subunit alcohol dehydrogenase family)